ncbi:hypothetical protein LTR53_014201 [Teratosphaeriaceae sp. CCFEE 6253]|nr:hypothetical protein LTR53_014201 [Teratosphaeriaceae sp. CCFEE 6253]
MSELCAVPSERQEKVGSLQQTGAVDARDLDDERHHTENGHYDSSSDKRDMRRLGKKQELKRRFEFFSIVSYVVVLGLTWEFVLTTAVFSLSNGGTAGAMWLTLIVCCGMACSVLSMSEMAMSEFAPPRLQKQLSYFVGWLCALGWQAAMPTVAYIGAQQVLALIAICDPSYAIQGWHGALVTMAFVLAAITFNTFAIGQLPALEKVAFFLHICGFFVFLGVFWGLGPRADAHTTFTTFSNDNGWSSPGIATLVGIVGPATTFLGGDSAVHLSEELRDASYSLPRAMIAAAVTNYVLGTDFVVQLPLLSLTTDALAAFIMVVTLMSNLGSIEDDLASSTGQAYVAVIQTITGSKAAAIVLVLIMIFMYFFCAVNQVTTSSRQIFAFARDKGLPFHKFLSRVRPGSGVPANSVYVTLVVTCLIALIIIGSTTAFNIILSVSSTGLFTSYIVVIACMLVKRTSGQKMPATRFSLGRLGVPINVAAICFLSLAYVFLFFPAAPKPTAASMNWASLIYGCVLGFAGVYYLIYGRHQYDGPVRYVKWQGDEVE